MDIRYQKAQKRLLKMVGDDERLKEVILKVCEGESHYIPNTGFLVQLADESGCFANGDELHLQLVVRQNCGGCLLHSFPKLSEKEVIDFLRKEKW